jgi:hypothetical protein
MPYIGNPIYQSAFVVDQFSGNGSTTAFTMSVAPAGVTNVLVAVSGVLQDPSTYGVVGNTITFSAAPPTGTGNISCRYLGVPVTGVTTTAYRTQTEFTATANQTTFTPPSYTVGFIDVYRNGALLGSADFTATNGTTVVLTNAASEGDLIETISFLVSSVLNAIPNTAGSVSSANIADNAITTANIADNAITTAKIAAGAVIQADLATGVAGTGPAFSAYSSSTGATLGTGATKVTFDTEEFDTNNNFASSRFTPTVAGYYQINAQTQPNASYTGGWIAVYKNGALYKYGTFANIGISFGGFTVSTIVYCNGSTDFIEIYGAFTTSQATGAGISFTWFNGALVRAA